MGLGKSSVNAQIIFQVSEKCLDGIRGFGDIRIAGISKHFGQCSADMRGTSVSILCVYHQRPINSSVVFSLINASYFRYHSTNTLMQICASWWVSILPNSLTSSSSSRAASLLGLRVIHSSTSRAICTVHRCKTASGDISRTALRIFAAPSQVTLRSEFPYS